MNHYGTSDVCFACCIETYGVVANSDALAVFDWMLYVRDCICGIEVYLVLVMACLKT
jgi:hypothetical protein